jgi:hypothetical protein
MTEKPTFPGPAGVYLLFSALDLLTNGIETSISIMYPFFALTFPLFPGVARRRFPGQ